MDSKKSKNVFEMKKIMLSAYLLYNPFLLFCQYLFDIILLCKINVFDITNIVDFFS